MKDLRVLRLVTTNLDFVTGPEKDQAHLEHLIHRFWVRRPPQVTGMVLGAQEARNFRLDTLLRKVGRVLAKVRIVPTVVQGDGLAKAGTAIAGFAVKFHHARQILLGTSRFTLPRWITRAGVDVDGGRLEVIVAHIAPPRAGKTTQAKQLAKVKRLTRRAVNRGHGWAVLADFNMMLAEVAAELDGVGYGTKRGIGIVVSNRVSVSDSGPDTYGVRHDDTDHPAWFVDVEGLIP